jgi:crossover junction endodeoxyribonuclease RusA
MEIKDKSTSLTFVLPYPPSSNHYWVLIPMGRTSRMIVGKRGKDYRKQVKAIVGNVECLKSRLLVDIYCNMPDKRKRDIDNLNKCVLDSLQEAKVFDDDFQIDHLFIHREARIIKEGKLMVCIDEISINKNLELENIKELIYEAYKLDTNKSALLVNDGYKIKYLMLDTWCSTLEDKLLLLKIIYKLIDMYPHRIASMAEHLLDNFSLISTSTVEISTLYSVINDLLHLRNKYEDQPRWDKYYKKV